MPLSPEDKQLVERWRREAYHQIIDGMGDVDCSRMLSEAASRVEVLAGRLQTVGAQLTEARDRLSKLEAQTVSIKDGGRYIEGLPEVSPLERACRALCEQQIRRVRKWDTDPDALERVLPGAVDRSWAEHVDTVRTVLQAIREPSEEMLEAAANTPGMNAASAAMEMHQVRGYGFAAGSFDAGSPLLQAWAAMIDAALSEAP